jgi:hypothetical protein
MSEPEPTIIRASSLPTYTECSRRGAASLFRPIIEAMGFKLRQLPHGAGAAVGTSLHKAAEITFAEKAKTGSTPPISLANDCAIETLREAVKEGIEFDGPRGTTQNQPIAEHQVISMSGAYHRVIVPKVNPVLVEERLSAAVAPGLILSGQPDIVAREPNAIRDLKSGARSPRAHTAQVGAYALLVRSHAILSDVTTGAIDFVRRVNPKNPQPDPISESVDISRAETAASRIIYHMAEDLRVFREGDDRLRLKPGDPWAFSANPNSLLCSARFCSAFGTDFCHEWRPKE